MLQNRRASKFLKRYAGVKKQCAKLLELNSHHPSLHPYCLSERLDVLKSIFINLKYRVTIEIIINESEIVLINIGNRDAVY